MHTLVLSVSKAHIMSLNINTANDADLAEFLSHNGFCEADANCLQALHPHISPLLPALTEAFYERILASDAMRPFVIDRVDSLKQTHLRWMNMLFSGPFDDQFVQIHQHIGEVHLKQKIPPLFVASSMAFLRAEMPKLFTPELFREVSTIRLCLLHLGFVAFNRHLSVFGRPHLLPIIDGIVGHFSQIVLALDDLIKQTTGLMKIPRH